jgi:RNA polymerase sigma-70 factor, ECF subfamily
MTLQEPDHEFQQMQAARADLNQFAPIYSRYFARIYAYCLHRVGNPHEAEDITSQVFTRAMLGLDQYRGGSVAAWLFCIAHNCVVDALRQRRSQVSLEQAENEGAAFRTDFNRLEETQDLQSLLAVLSEEQRTLLSLKLVGGLNAAEIGAVVGKSAVAVRVELHRIIKRLRVHYQESEKMTHES